MVSADQCCYLNNVEQTRNRARSTFHFSFTVHLHALLHSVFPLFHLRLLIPVLFLPFFPFTIVLSSFAYSCLFLIYCFLFCHFSSICSLSQQHIFLLSFILPFFLLSSPVFFFLPFPVTAWWVIGSCMKRIHMHNNLIICSTHVYDMSDHRVTS